VAEFIATPNNLCLPEFYYPTFKRSGSKMSGTSDKARFYLEQAVPQLQEFKEKEIFTTVRLPTSYAAPILPILFDPG
jgi:hypothetical protein